MKKEAILKRARNFAAYDPQFTTKEGWLTQYALKCGYVQRIEHSLSGKYANLEADSGTTYSVFTNIENKYHGWHSYDTLAEARKVFLIIAKIVASYTKE
jgi:hypothetical protein